MNLFKKIIYFMFKNIFDCNNCEPEWIVNDLGELGVKIKNRFFFLYKGENIEYNGKHDDGTKILYRTVGKREFGETCHPKLYWENNWQYKDKYDLELMYDKNDKKASEKAKWKSLPSNKKGY